MNSKDFQDLKVLLSTIGPKSDREVVLSAGREIVGSDTRFLEAVYVALDAAGVK